MNEVKGPREYKRVSQSEVDPASATTTSSPASQRRRMPFDARSARNGVIAAWIVFAVAVIVGGVVISQQSSRSANEINSGDTESSPSSQTADTSAVVNVPPSLPPTPTPVSTPVVEDENDIDTSLTTSKPTQQTTSDPATGVACDEVYDCLSDRLGQNEALKAGQAICSRDNRYMFGMDDGSLIWKDCTTGETKKYYKKGDAGDYFIMDETAKFTIHGEDGQQVKWEKNCKATVTKYEKCLSKPEYDCPYLHLHRGGVVVLNYIDGWDWISKNIKKMYDF